MRLMSRVAGIRLAALAAVLICIPVTSCAATSATAQAPLLLPTATRMSVMLSTDFATYHASQAIGVTVYNSAAVGYFTTDSHSACTVITLQERVRGQWIGVMPCQTGQSPHVLVIAARSSVPYTLAPGNASGNPNAWDPGVYRIALAFGARGDGSDVNSHVVFSAGFVIGS